MTTRRDFLVRFSAVAGVAGAYAAMHAMGLSGDEAWAGMPNLAPGSGTGTKVVILGAGVAGLSAAYELGKAGYDCTIIEARDCVGGRNFTVRKGTTIEMKDRETQTCDFSEGQWFNAGPARIPSHHQATLGYCKELGVAMEVEVNWSGSALIQADRLNDAKPITQRQAIYDYRGHIAELFAKCVKKGALDSEMSADDIAKLMQTFSSWGGLTESGVKELVNGVSGQMPTTYTGNERSGFAELPSAGPVKGEIMPPLPLSVVGDPFVQGVAGFADIIDMQATMQQPVGGMDMIPKAFEAKLPGIIKKNCEVTAIKRRKPNSKTKAVEITYKDKATGKPVVISADLCICTIPLPVLNRISNDFSKPVKAAIARNAENSPGFKIAFEGPRFWETDNHIYGGLSFTDRDTFTTWYPSYGFHSPRGVVVAGYAFSDKMGKRSLADQQSYALGTMERLHPGRSKDLSVPISINWTQVPYSEGLASNMAQDNPADYALLSEPDGPFYFAGEHLSYVGAWQQGAFVSSHRVVNAIAARKPA